MKLRLTFALGAVLGVVALAATHKTSALTNQAAASSDPIPVCTPDGSSCIPGGVKTGKN